MTGASCRHINSDGLGARASSKGLGPLSAHWLLLYSPMNAHHHPGASLVAQMVKNLPVMQETQAQYLGWEDPLEKEMATHSSILARRIPWVEEFQLGHKELDMTK